MVCGLCQSYVTYWLYGLSVVGPYDIHFDTSVLLYAIHVSVVTIGHAQSVSLRCVCTMPGLDTRCGYTQKRGRIIRTKPAGRGSEIERNQDEAVNLTQNKEYRTLRASVLCLAALLVSSVPRER